MLKVAIDLKRENFFALLSQGNRLRRVYRRVDDVAALQALLQRKKKYQIIGAVAHLFCLQDQLQIKKSATETQIAAHIQLKIQALWQKVSAYFDYELIKKNRDVVEVKFVAIRQAVLDQQIKKYPALKFEVVTLDSAALSRGLQYLNEKKRLKLPYYFLEIRENYISCGIFAKNQLQCFSQKHSQTAMAHDAFLLFQQLFREQSAHFAASQLYLLVNQADFENIAPLIEKNFNLNVLPLPTLNDPMTASDLLELGLLLGDY